MSLRAKAACNEAIHLYNAEKYDEAFYIFKSIADEEPNACYYLYLQYKLGRGVEPDFDEAIKWLVRSVDGDDSDISSNIIMIAEECSRAGEYERVLAVGEKLISRQDMRGYYILAREYISGNIPFFLLTKSTYKPTFKKILSQNINNKIQKEVHSLYTKML